MQYEIVSYVGAGPIMLGMTREEVRKAINAPVHEFRKTPSDEYPADLFEGPGIEGEYRYPGVYDLVGFSGPISLTYQGESFLSKPYRAVQSWVEAIDPDVSLNGAGLISFQLGVAIYAPAAIKEPDEPVEAVSIFERGYYDEWLTIRADGLKYYISPYDYVGPLKLGRMTVEQVRNALGTAVRTYIKPGQTRLSDAFDSLGIHVEYRPPGICTAVEFRGPDYPILGARRLLGKPFSEMQRWFTAIDPTLESKGTELVSPRFGLVLRVSAASEKTNVLVEAVIVFEQGYEFRG